MKIGKKFQSHVVRDSEKSTYGPFFGIHDILSQGHIVILTTFLYGSSWFRLGKMTPRYHDGISSPLRDRARKVSKIDLRVTVFSENWRKCLVGQAILPIIMLGMSPKWVSRQKVPRYHQELKFNPTQSLKQDKTYGRNGQNRIFMGIFDRKSAMFDLLHRLDRLHSTHNYFSTATTYHKVTPNNK